PAAVRTWRGWAFGAMLSNTIAAKHGGKYRTTSVHRGPVDQDVGGPAGELAPPVAPSKLGDRAFTNRRNPRPTERFLLLPTFICHQNGPSRLPFSTRRSSDLRQQSELGEVGPSGLCLATLSPRSTVANIGPRAYRAGDGYERISYAFANCTLIFRSGL